MIKRIALVLIGFLFCESALAGDPIKIMKSQVGPSFVADVSSYVADLADWKTHMAKVEADKAAGVPKERAHAPFPAPLASPAVAAAIDENGHPNYQIIDDDPTPEQVLSEKKKNLFYAVRRAEEEAKSRVIPPGKIRILGMHQNAIMESDQKRAAVLLSAQPVGMLSGIGIGAKKDIAKAQADARSSRSPEDAQFMQEQAARQAKIESIESVAIQMESDIEDLTTGNIDSWKMTPFPN